MGWRDSLAAMNAISASPTAIPAVSRGPLVSGGSFGSFNIGSDSGFGFSSPTPPRKSQAAAFPEKIQFSAPFSSGFEPYKAPPAKDTVGDWWASLQQSVNDFVGGGQNANLGNIIPRLIEAPGVLAHGFADGLVGTPLEPVRGFVTQPLDTLNDGIQKFSEIAGPVIEALPNYARDQDLIARSQSYRDLVSGRKPTGGSLWTIRDEAKAIALTTWGRDDMSDAEATRLAAEMIDLPDSVKRALRANPDMSDDEINRLLDSAPEGRQWSYREGLAGLTRNLMAPGLFYAATGLGGFRALAAARASTVPVVATTGKAITLAAQIQTRLAAVGGATLAASVAVDTVGRVYGDQAVVDMANTMFNTHPISDDPHVQLVTSFSVNPFAAVGALKRGVVSIRGLGEVAVGKATGAQLARLYTQDDLMFETLAKMYRITPEEARGYIGQWYNSKGEVWDHIVELAADDVMARKALDVRVKLQNGIPDPIQRAQEVLRLYGPEIAETIFKHPGRLASRFQQRAWEYHGYRGGFDPEVAARNALDYRGVKELTYAARQRMEAVVGYVDVLHPQAAADIRAALERVPDGPVPDRLVNDFIEKYPALREYVGLTYKPGELLTKADVEAAVGESLRKYEAMARRNPTRATTGADPILRPGFSMGEYATALGTTEDVVNVITNAQIDATTVDTLRAFLRDRVGITESTIAGLTPEQAWVAANEYADDVARPWIENGARIAAAEQRVSGLLTRARSLRFEEQQGGFVDPAEMHRLEREIATLNELIGITKDPPLPYSARVRAAEGEVVAAQAHKAAVEAATEKIEAQAVLDELAVIEDEANNLLGAWQVGYDPIPEQRAVAAAMRKMRDVRATEEAEAAARARGEKVPTGRRRQWVYRTGDEVAGEAEQAATRAREAASKRLDWRVMLRRNREGEWTVSGGYPPVPDSLFGRLMDATYDPVRRKALMEASDPKLWAIISEHYYKGILRKDLTPAQRKLVERVTRGQVITHTADDVAADAWATKNSSQKMSADSSGAHLEEDWLERLGQLADRWDELLAGRRKKDVVRTAERVVPQAALDDATMGRFVYDPLFEVRVHPENIARLRGLLEEINAGTGDSFLLLREAKKVVREDPILEARIVRSIDRNDPRWPSSSDDPGAIVDHLEAGELARGIPDGWEPRPIGEIVPRTPLEQAVLGGDHPAVAKLMDESGALLQRVQRTPPVKDVPVGVAKQVVGRGHRRPSTQYTERLTKIGADLTTRPDAAILADPANRVGRDVLGIINRGFAGPGTEPRTIRGLIEVLREIENGGAARLGLSPEFLAEGQRVANRLLDHAVHASDAAAFVPGLFSKGADPRLLPEQEMAYIRDLMGRGDIVADPKDPTGLQYGFKKPPKGAVTWELEEARRIAEESGVAGIGEEFITKHFEPFESRLGIAQVRQAFNFVFGPLHNTDIALQAQARFISRLAAKGIDASHSEAIWHAWRRASADTRSDIMRTLTGGRIVVEKGDNPLYASPRNIPTATLQRIAQETIASKFPDGGMPPQYATADFAREFHQSTSFILRSLEDSSIPLARALGATYGAVTTNKAVTTMYYLFRFGLDLRYHAMNKFEPYFLGAGRSALLPTPENTQGLLGWTKQRILDLSVDGLTDTGYPLSQSRAATAYRSFWKEQPGKLAERMKGLQSEDPALMERALREIAETDPELSRTIALMGDTPQSWLKALDDWHGRILESSNIDADIAQSIADEIARTPALAEVFGRLEQVNTQLWADVRGTFFGNPARSRVERALNSYLLYWPLSYQIKSTKWLMRVLFDRAGGLPTNAGGAFLLDKVMEKHNELLLNDPEYGAWFEDHPTLVFAAQMLMPISWNSIGVSLSPPLRNLFFGRSKQIMEIGPVYTVSEFTPQLVGDLYQTVGDLPGMDWLYRSFVGREAPENPGGAPIDDLIGNLDTIRFGQ